MYSSRLVSPWGVNSELPLVSPAFALCKALERKVFLEPCSKEFYRFARGIKYQKHTVLKESASNAYSAPTQDTCQAYVFFIVYDESFPIEI